MVNVSELIGTLGTMKRALEYDSTQLMDQIAPLMKGEAEKTFLLGCHSSVPL